MRDPINVSVFRQLVWIFPRTPWRTKKLPRGPIQAAIYPRLCSRTFFFWTWTVFGLNLDTLEVNKSDFWWNLHGISRRNFLDHRGYQIPWFLMVFAKGFKTSRIKPNPLKRGVRLFTCAQDSPSDVFAGSKQATLVACSAIPWWRVSLDTVMELYVCEFVG